MTPEEAKTKWQPIETAPRDGTPILLFHCDESVGENMSIAKFDPYYAERGRGYDGPFQAWRSVPDSEPVELYFGQATHWAHLPGSPSQSDGFTEDEK